MIIGKRINSLENFIGHIRKDRAKWGDNTIAWFRGEPNVSTPLLPKVFRQKSDGGNYNENSLLQMFRMKAPSFANIPTPDRQHTDQWLFLAQHVGLPTRLLDWTESALLGLYFALLSKEPVVWMLNPIELNLMSISESQKNKIVGGRSFPLTWFTPQKPIINIGVENIKGAWEISYDGLELPVAIHPTYIHPRMSAQRSVFTVHGANKKPMSELVPGAILFRYDIEPSVSLKIKADLHLLGINDSTAFPDLDGLARELSAVY